MKRRITVAVLTAIMLFSFSGCTDVPTKVSVVSIEEPPVEPVQEKTEPLAEVKPEPVTTGYSGIAYSTEFDMAVLVTNGEVERLYDLSRIPSDVCGISGDYVVTLEREYFANEGNYHSLVNVYNLPLGYDFTLYSGYDVVSADVYGETVYITCQDSESGTYTEKAFDIKTGETRQSEGDEYYGDITGFSFAGEGLKEFDYSNNPCYLRLRDKSPYAVLRKGYGEYYTYDGELIEALLFDGNISEVFAYDEDALIYSSYPEDSYFEMKLMARTSEGEDVEISSDYSCFLQYEGGVVYYAVEDDTVFATPTTVIHAYDIFSESDRILTTATKHPGIRTEIRPGISGFKCIGDYIYYIADNGVDVLWYKLSLDGTEYKEGTPLGVPLEMNKYAGIGTVSAISDTLYCDKCGKPYLKFGTEYFIFDEGVSPFYEKMNATLLEDAKEMKEGFENGFITDEMIFSCEYHGTPYNYVYEENDVTNVSYRTEKYIVVDESGYWYGGGAHGQEFLSHTLFDLTTGEKVTIRDLFDGSLEELKDIVARYTQSDMVNRADESPYFSDDPDVIYDTAFEMISFDNFPCEYGENEIIIEYAPYEMGAYASGIISVSIPYSEFGLDGVLN